MHPMRILLVLLVTAVFAGPADANDKDLAFRKGLSAFNEGHYARALTQWEPLAAAGDARAQESVGFMYYSGCGVPNGQQATPASLTTLCKTVQIPAGGTYTFDEFDFNGAISGMDVTIVFTHNQVGGGPTHTSTLNFTVP